MTDNYKIVEIMRNEPGVIIADIIPDDMKKEILKLEMKRVDEIVPFINKGMQHAFDEKEALLVITDNEKRPKRDVQYTDESTFTLRSDTGEILGEMIYDEDELEELRNDPTVYFLSDNFVTYNNVPTSGKKQFFVMDAETSKFITDKDIDSTVKSLVVAVPSTETDHFIKDCYDLPHDTHIGTVIIGFTPFD